jgi:17beta-estradiol 17-dehydrogenase / very-long-chain 3-oxoacyl-CoA reductase
MTCGLSSEVTISWWWAVPLLVAAYPLAKFLAAVLYEGLKQLVPPLDLLARYCRKDVESWAVVTGATDGIGLGFCEVLVSLGFNLVLISRNPDKLQTTVERLQALRPGGHPEARLKTIAFNFKDSSDSAKYEALIAELRGLDIGLLVNNVGTSDVKQFHRFSHREIVDFINVNCVSMAVLSADVLGLMKGRSHKSALINLSSYMAEHSLPFLSLYAATKAFNKHLTQGLAYEYPELDVLCLQPLFVESPLSKQKRGFTVPDRRECAADSLRELRWEHQSNGYISHRILGAIFRYLCPDWLYRLVVKAAAKKFLRRSFPDAKID